MKKVVSIMLAVTMLGGALVGCSSSGESTTAAVDTKETSETTAKETAKETEGTVTEGAVYSGTISIAAGKTVANGLEAALAGYQEINPDVDLDITITTDVTDFETMMTTWIASDNLPDMYIQQVGATEQKYAAEGYLMPLTDVGVAENLIDGDTSLISHGGEMYAFPMSVSISVVLANNAALKKAGIELTSDNYPTCWPEFLALMDQCVAAGVPYPFGVAGADLSAVTAWPFQYMYQVLYGGAPDWYADVLTSKRSWSDPEFVKMFQKYDELAGYISPDSLGKDNNGMLADFIGGNTIFYCQTATSIASIKELDPEADILLLPSCFTEKAEDQTIISGFDDGISITSSAKDPELCINFLQYLTSPEGSTLFNNESGFVPTVKGCKSEIDPAYDIVYNALQKGDLPNSPILSRQWIAGFKEILKSGCQNWFAGEEPQTVADTIQKEHSRLMEADPDWVAGFLESYQYK